MKRLHRSIKASAIILGLFICLLFLTPNSIYATLVGCWSFDENSGTTAYDSSGYDNTGTIYGATWVTGMFGSALSFDGIDDYVDILNSLSLNTSTFTISLWVSFYDLDMENVLLDKRNGQWAHNYQLLYMNDKSVPTGTPEDYLMVAIGDGSYLATDFSNTAYAVVDLVEDEFYYIAGTYDQSYLILYLDGVEIARLAIDITGNTGSGDVHIGTHGYTWMSPTYGIIDEVHIYDNALSQSEILADMGTPVPEPTTILLFSTGLIGFVAFRRRIGMK